jgi:hypothetical protein
MAFVNYRDLVAAYAGLDPANKAGDCGCGLDHACLEGLESASVAQVEGFASYFATRVFSGNKLYTTEHPCTYMTNHMYYDSQRGNGYPPPFRVSCSDPVRWRLNRCTPTTDGVAGVEWDWMNFYRSTAFGLDNGERIIPFKDMLEIQRRACGGACETTAVMTYDQLLNAAITKYGGSTSPYVKRLVDSASVYGL